MEASEACEKKVDGLNLVNLHMANMEVLYPKWFDECMSHSKLGDLFVTARINMLDTTFMA